MMLALQLRLLRHRRWLIAAAVILALLWLMSSCEVPPGGEWKVG